MASLGFLNTLLVSLLWSMIARLKAQNMPYILQKTAKQMLTLMQKY